MGWPRASSQALTDGVPGVLDEGLWLQVGWSRTVGCHAGADLDEIVGGHEAGPGFQGGGNEGDVRVVTPRLSKASEELSDWLPSSESESELRISMKVVTSGKSSSVLVKGASAADIGPGLAAAFAVAPMVEGLASV